LKASAVALALTELPAFPQMRAKKLGRLARVNCTVTMGLTPNAEFEARVWQSVLELIAPLAPAP
jgi:hypothetical protein